MGKNSVTHPSYGMAQFNRVSGGRPKLFGSELSDHYSTVVLSVSRGDVDNTGGRNWYHRRAPVIEVEFSAAQFVELISTLNCGDGIPCTIRFEAGKGRVEDPPTVKTEADLARDHFTDRVKATTEKMRTIRARIATLGDLPKLKRADQKELMDCARALVQEVERNIPFYYEQFNEAVERRETQAKAEIDASVMATLQRLGLTKLQSDLIGTADESSAKQLEGNHDDLPNNAVGRSDS